MIEPLLLTCSEIQGFAIFGIHRDNRFCGFDCFGNVLRSDEMCERKLLIRSYTNDKSCTTKLQSSTVAFWIKA